MSCKSIFVNLGGGGGGTVNTGVLQIAGGVALDSTLRFVEDQAGTDSTLKLSTTRASVVLPDCTTDFSFSRYNATINLFNGIGSDGGTIYSFLSHNFVPGANRGSFNINGLYVGDPNIGTQNGSLTVVSIGGNIASFRSSSNVERFVLTNDGNLTISDGFFANYGSFASGSNGVKIGAGLRIKNPADGVMLLQNDNANNFDRLQLGGTTASFSSIKRSGINIEVRLADDTGYGGITAGRSTEKTLEVLEVSGAMGLGFFNTPAINQPTTAIGEAIYTSNGGGAIHIDDTIGGYTMQQVVQALQNLGLLA
jgi:hypothetical protein